MLKGRLLLVCSPIGNLGDITYRAVEALKMANLIACEDTRHSRKLLSHYQIEFSELVAFHDHNETTAANKLAERISSEGITLALISDAGTPSINDPGYRLVKACIELEIPIEVLPGPSAVTTALPGSGLPSDQFAFRGFLPVKSGKKEKMILEALNSAGTTIFFESPHRILKTLALVDQLDPDRPVCVARELTKKFETYHRGTASEVLADFGNKTVKGEITFLIQGLTRSKKTNERHRA